MVGLKMVTGRVCPAIIAITLAAFNAYPEQATPGQQAPPSQPQNQQRAQQPADTARGQEPPRVPLAAATPKNAQSNVPIQFQSHGLEYEALTKEGITVMFAPLPQQLKEFRIFQVTITNGSLVSWTVRPTDFSFTKPDGATMQALTADEVVASLLDKAGRNDVIKLQLLYENSIYALANYRPTNGYERRREAALAQFVNMRFSAAAAASAIALAPLKLNPGDSTDGAIFFENRPREKNFAGGLLLAHTCGQAFTFQTAPELKVK